MTEVHLVVGIALLAANLVAGVWGGLAWLRREPAVGFWYALRIAQVLVIVQAMLGLVVIWLGSKGNGLHILYGALPVLVSFLAELARAGAAQQELGAIDVDELDEPQKREVALAVLRRETGIMAVACLVIFFLALRAAGTTSLI